MSDVKQVIVIRKDLKMRSGKECAQVAHASMKIFFDRMKEVYHGGYARYSTWECSMTTEMTTC